MPCKYHINAPTQGVCKCGKEFCSDCANLFIEGKNKIYLCLDCAAGFAKKRITQSYIAAAIGFGFGIFLVKEIGFFAPVIYGYLFWGTFFGWHYGGRIWPMLAKIDFAFWGLILLSLRLTFSIIVGVFGGGIAQFLLYRKMIKKQQSLIGVPMTA